MFHTTTEAQSLSKNIRITSWFYGALSVVLIILPQLRYHTLHTSYFDLGQYTTNYTAVVIDGIWEIAFRSHAHPIMFLVAPFFWIAPHVQILLIIQSLIIIFGIFLYIKLWNCFGSRNSLIGLMIISASPAVWTSALFDYHFEHFLFLLYILFFLRLESPGRWKRLELVLISLAIACVKESLSLTSFGLGLYLFLSRRDIILGLIIMIISILYFQIITTIIIPIYSDGQQSGEIWSVAFSYLGSTPLEMARNLLYNPSVLISNGVLSERKFIFLIAVSGPFIIVFIRFPLLFVPALPHIVIAFISKNQNHSYIASQYVVPILLPMLVATAYTLVSNRQNTQEKLNENRIAFCNIGTLARFFAIVGSVICLALFSISPLSRLFFTSRAWSYNFAAYLPTARDAMIRSSINEHIPADRSRSVSMQNTLHHGRLSLRTYALAFPDGVFEPAKVHCFRNNLSSAVNLIAPCRRSESNRSILVEYVVLDSKRPPYILDVLVESYPTGASAMIESYGQLVRKLGYDFNLVTEADGFQIWRRKP